MAKYILICFCHSKLHSKWLLNRLKRLGGRVGKGWKVKPNEGKVQVWRSKKLECTWVNLPAETWRLEKHLINNTIINARSSISLLQSDSTAACCRTYAWRGRQTSERRCPDRSDTDSWQVPVALHGLLWVHDSAWHNCRCCCVSYPTLKPFHHLLPSLTFP